MTRLLVAGVLLTLLLAGVISSFASSDPDGLDSALLVGCTVDTQGQIVGGECPAQNAADSATAGSPLADYSVDDSKSAWSTGISGVAGVLVTLAVGWALFGLLRRREPAVHGG